MRSAPSLRGPPGGSRPATPLALILSPAVAGFLPGALAGVQLAGLLFFLNPHLPFSGGSLFRASLFYSGLLGVVGMALLAPLTWGRPARAWSWVPSTLSAILAAAAISAWYHAHYYAFYLPAGINRRLLKAGVWLAVGALVCFYTALLHRLRRRPYGLRSRLLLATMAGASIYVVVERREAFNQPLGPGPRPTRVEGSQRPFLVVVGLEAATLDAILPLAEQGRLPFFSHALEEGAFGRITTLRPTRRSPVWATLAAGKYPYQHGVVADEVYRAPPLAAGGSLTLLPRGVGFARWGVWGEASRPGPPEVRALWEILPRLEVPTAVVGWPTAAPSATVVVPERFFEEGGSAEGVTPPELAARALLFRTPVEELDMASRFGSRPPRGVLDALAGDVWRESLSFVILDQGPELQACFLSLPGLAQLSAEFFGAYAAVQFEGHRGAPSTQATQLLAAYYQHLDEFLSELWGRLPEPRLLVVVSGHGAAAPTGPRELWRVLTRRPPLAGSLRGAPEGLLLLLGQGIRPGPIPQPAKLVDVAPTILYGLGFPIAYDFDGAVLTDAFDTAFLARQPLTFVPSYEALSS